MPQGLQQVRRERRDGALAIGAGDGDVRHATQREESHFHFAHHRHAGGARGRERRRVRGNAGAGNDQRCGRYARQVVRAAVDRDARRAQLGGGLRHGRAVTGIGGVDAPPFTHEEPGGSDAAAAQPDDGNLAAVQRVVDHRSFSVLNARKAHRMPRIQKRTTTCASGHPASSKWWCTGARLKTRCARAYSIPNRRLRHLNTVRCMSTDVVSATNTPPMMSSRNSLFSRIATVLRAPPRASDPVSPMNTSAGCELYHRNPTHAPKTALQKTVSSPELRR